MIAHYSANNWDPTQATSTTTSTALQQPTPEVPNARTLVIKILSINVCGLKSKLLVKEFTDYISNYDVVCMCETRCDDADTNNIKEIMENHGFDIVYKNRSALSRYKSGGLLIALKNNLNVRWKEMKSDDETLLSISVSEQDVGLGNDLIITCIYIPPSHSRYGKSEHFDELNEFFSN